MNVFNKICDLFNNETKLVRQKCIKVQYINSPSFKNYDTHLKSTSILSSPQTIRKEWFRISFSFSCLTFLPNQILLNPIKTPCTDVACCLPMVCHFGYKLLLELQGSFHCLFRCRTSQLQEQVQATMPDMGHRVSPPNVTIFNTLYSSKEFPRLPEHNENTIGGYTMPNIEHPVTVTHSQNQTPKSAIHRILKLHFPFLILYPLSKIKKTLKHCTH